MKWRAMSSEQPVLHHANAFGLLGFEPPVSSTAEAAVAETESRLGIALPESVRQWYIRQGEPVGPGVWHQSHPRALVGRSPGAAALPERAGGFGRQN
jgi:hypothetical protein